MAEGSGGAAAAMDESRVLHIFKTIHIDFTPDPSQFIDTLAPGYCRLSNFEVTKKTTFQDILNEFEDDLKYRLYYDNEYAGLGAYNSNQRIAEFYRFELRTATLENTLFLLAMPAHLNIIREEDQYEGQAASNLPFLWYFRANAIERESKIEATDLMRKAHSPGWSETVSAPPRKKLRL